MISLIILCIVIFIGLWISSKNHPYEDEMGIKIDQEAPYKLEPPENWSN